MKLLINFLITLLFVCSLGYAQELPARWDELTTSEWNKALEKSSRTCILPIGILEKHGPHSPLGSDLIHVREIAARTVKNEYAVVFPDYFYGQINEARQQPGTFALQGNLILNLLEATCDEIARNGFDKIIILNGHGGNPEFLRFFMQSLLGKRRDYAVYLFDPGSDREFEENMKKMRKTDARYDMHAGERETSTLLYLRPDLMRMDQADSESGEDQKRLSTPNLYTPIWWYAGFPNHYAGVGSKSTKELGKLIAEHTIDTFTKAVKAVKADTKTIQLQNEYFDRVEKVRK
ncbi:MAG TPA: creatininase family protein [Sphingobacteriaceae bacterium]